MVESYYEEKQARKLERFQELAEKNSIVSVRMYDKSHELADMIPFGQPILVGHHSEGRHRRHLEKINSTFRKAIEAKDKSEYYAAKAERIENPYAISSDDPEAVTKLKEKLAGIEAEIEKVKAHNKKCKDFVKLEVVCSHRENEEQIANTNGNYKRYATINKTTKEIKWESSRVPKDIRDKIETYAKTGILEKTNIAKENKVFDSYHLTNLNGNKTRIKKRIEELSSLAKVEEIEETLNGITLSIDKEQNRVKLAFPGKPTPEIISKLKHSGFHWSPYQKVWMRMISDYALSQAREIQKELEA